MNLDYDQPVKIAEGIYWIGYYDKETGLHCNPYLIIDNDEAVIIDGGSRLSFPTVLKKILQTGVFPASITALIYQHYDPDLYGSIRSFEQVIDKNNLLVISEKEYANSSNHCHNKSTHVTLSDVKGKLEFSSGRRLQFFKTPYSYLEGSFVLYLQPILDIRSDCIVGHEVLLRLKGESGEIITPPNFFDAAEHFGLMPDIDYWVVRKSIHLAKNLCKYSESTYLEVNLSGKAFADDKLLRLIKDELAVTGIDPACIVFEITETTVIENITIARHFIAELKSLGFRFALDDFGVGSSSFNYLKHLPVDYLKIDGSFVRNLLHDTMDQHLVKVMVEVARGLGKKTIAKFVESWEILGMLQKYGVDYAQGYYVGEPCDVSKHYRH